MPIDPISGAAVLGSTLFSIFGGSSKTDPNAVNTALGPYRCDAPHDQARVNALKSGDVSMFAAIRSPGVDEGRSPAGPAYPFPLSRFPRLTDDMRKANFYAWQVWRHSGQDSSFKGCSNYASAAQEWLEANLGRIQTEAARIGRGQTLGLSFGGNGSNQIETNNRIGTFGVAALAVVAVVVFVALLRK